MTVHDWYVEHRVAFATRSLAASDEALFANHLARCEACRLAVAEIERELAWLPLGVSPVAPRPGLTRQLLEGVLRRRRSRWWAWAAVVATAASVMLALFVRTSVSRQITGLRMALAAREGQLVAIQDSLSAILGAERVLQETIRGPGYVGGFLLFYDQDTQRWNVVVHDLPPARSGETYQLWFVSGRGLLPGPEVRVDGSRPTFLVLPAPSASSDIVGAALTLGPIAGPAGRVRGVELARLTF